MCKIGGIVLLANTEKSPKSALSMKSHQISTRAANNNYSDCFDLMITVTINDE